MIMDKSKILATHTVSVEKLHHFNCHYCRRWWSIGDLPSEVTHLYCPWCGEYGELGEKQHENHMMS
jgi:hypothetical protein